MEQQQQQLQLLLLLMLMLLMLQMAYCLHRQQAAMLPAQSDHQVLRLQQLLLLWMGRNNVKSAPAVAVAWGSTCAASGSVAASICMKIKQQRHLRCTQGSLGEMNP
jgi:hypothetical protein